MFTSKASASDTSFQPSQPGYGRAILPVGKSNLAHHRLSPMLLSPPMAGPGPVKLPNEEPVIPAIPARPVSFPRPPLNPGLRPGLQPADTSKVKQMGEMLRQQWTPGTKPLLPGTNQPSSPAQSPVAAFCPSPRQPPRPKISTDVSPLRRPLPPDGALPLKPKRPPNVNLKPFLQFKRGSSLPGQRQRDGESVTFTLVYIVGAVSIILVHFFSMSSDILMGILSYTWSTSMEYQKKINKPLQLR